MPSSLTWIDHDAAARERSLRVLALFQEKESRDELGLGPIRDAFSDRLFPGTSTIQTRLRYMLFVPWVYRALERQKVLPAEIAARARRAELALVRPLLASDEQSGVFGRTKGDSLKRLPSSVYWAGLGSWGVLQFHGSQDQYHRGLDDVYRRRGRRPDRDGDVEEHDRLGVTWHPKLPPEPKGFPEGLDFRLTASEAEFLRDRIVVSRPDSLLAHLCRGSEPADVEYPWEHPDLARFTPAHRELLEHARCFSAVMQGAAIVYNVMLAELAEKPSLVAEHGERLAAWRTDLDEAAIRHWSLPRLWDLTMGQGHDIRSPTRQFVTAWVDLVLSVRGPLSDHWDARRLVEHRERHLKKARSRFGNRRALEQWGGYAGLGRLSFRWPTARTFLRELHTGLRRP